MVIALNFEAGTKDNALWIFPVPGTLKQTKGDIVDSFPRFQAVDVRGKAAFRIEAHMMLARATQIYPLFVEPMLLFWRKVQMTRLRNGAFV